MFNKKDITRNECMLVRGQAKRGYDWWWHSFTGRHAITGEEKAFFIEFFLCNPAYGTDEPIFGQLPENKKEGKAVVDFVIGKVSESTAFIQFVLRVKTTVSDEVADADKIDESSLL